MSYRCILLFGQPGCGKTTMGRALGHMPDLVHFSTGDMFRSLDPKSTLGEKVVSCTDKGELVPDEPTIRLWQHFTGQMVEQGMFDPDRDTLILDGIPINIAQAKMLTEDVKIIKIIEFVTVDENALLARIQERAIVEGRADDANKDAIVKRRDLFYAQTQPLLEFYDASLVEAVNAMNPPMSVLRDTAGALEAIWLGEDVPGKTKDGGE